MGFTLTTTWCRSSGSISLSILSLPVSVGGGYRVPEGYVVKDIFFTTTLDNLTYLLSNIEKKKFPFRRKHLPN
jgi:hypothetical protein